MPSPNCGAKTRSGNPCKRRPMPNGRCHLHGGKSPVGSAHGRYVDGRHSKYLPAQLQARFTEALADPSMLELKPEIALIDGRLSELLQQLGNEQPADISKLWAEFREAIAAGNGQKIGSLAKQIDEVLVNGRDRERTWNQLGEQIDRRIRLVESERKRLVQQQEFVAAEQMRHFIIRIQQLIEENVTDRGALINITNGLYALTNAP